MLYLSGLLELSTSSRQVIGLFLATAAGFSRRLEGEEGDRS